MLNHNQDNSHWSYRNADYPNEKGDWIEPFVSSAKRFCLCDSHI